MIRRQDIVLEFCKFVTMVVVCGGSMVVKWGAGRFADVAYDPGSIAVSVVVGEENRIFSQGIRRSKEWKDELLNVVLKSEEIMYSKANSEGRELEAGKD
ncbi:hypothetical protein Tco_1102412 [Tanacetum coccineum]